MKHLMAFSFSLLYSLIKMQHFYFFHPPQFRMIIVLVPTPQDAKFRNEASDWKARKPIIFFKFLGQSHHKINSFPVSSEPFSFGCIHKILHKMCLYWGI